MKTTTRTYFTIAAAAISFALSSYGSSGTTHKEISSDVKMNVRPSIEMLFGPSNESMLKAIRRFVGEDTPKCEMATNIVRSSRSSAYSKTIGEPMTKEEWMRTFWVVEGGWIPPMEYPAETNLCSMCRWRLRNTHDLISIYTWIDAEKGDGFTCEKDGIRFGFEVKRLAKCSATTRIITYTSKLDPCRQMNFPKYFVECLAVCSNWEEFESFGLWKEEQERKETYMRGRREEEEKRKREAVKHPKGMSSGNTYRHNTKE